MKASLEEAARNTNRSVARLLDEIVAEGLDALGQESEAEVHNQRRLHARAADFAGRFSGPDPLGNESANTRLRARLKEDRTRVR